MTLNAPTGNGKKTGKTILVVDDDEQLLYLIKVRLENARYTPYVARNSEEAFQILQNNTIDLIILDIVLPGKNGYEICYDLKQSEKYSSIPVIMLSQKDKTKDRYDAARIGADGYISKPFEGAELIYKIEAVLLEFNEGLEVDIQRMYFPMGGEGHVLVVDDSSTMRKIIRNALRQLGIIRIIEAEDGASALDQLNLEKVTLILSDWDMPGVDGLKLLEKVKTDGRFSHIPFIMVTTMVGDRDMDTVFKKGANGYIAKPFSKIELKRTLEKLIKKGEFYAQKGQL